MKDSNKGKHPQNGRRPRQALPWRGTCGCEWRARRCHLCRLSGLLTRGTPSPALPLSSLSTYRPPAQDSLLPSLLPSVQKPPSSELPKTDHYQNRHLRTRLYTTSQLLRAQPPSSAPGSSGKELQPHTCTCHRQKVKVLPWSRAGVPFLRGTVGTTHLSVTLGSSAGRHGNA